MKDERVERARKVNFEYQHNLVGTATCIDALRGLLSVVEEQRVETAMLVDGSAKADKNN